MAEICRYSGEKNTNELGFMRILRITCLKQNNSKHVVLLLEEENVRISKEGEQFDSAFILYTKGKKKSQMEKYRKASLRRHQI